MSETRRVIEDGMELFRVPSGTDVWFEDLAPAEWGFRVHINPAPEDIPPGWSRTWPAPNKDTSHDG